MTDPAREAAERIVEVCKDVILSPFGEDAITLARAYLALPTAGGREAQRMELARIIAGSPNYPCTLDNELKIADAILASGFRRAP